MKKYTVIVTGGKDLKDYELIEGKLDKQLCNIDREIELINADNLGTDKRVRRYAKKHGYIYTKYEPDFYTDPVYCKADNNMRMIMSADAVVVFYNGTDENVKQIIQLAMIKGIPYRVVKYERQLYANELAPTEEQMQRISILEQTYPKFTGKNRGEASAYINVYGRMF